MAFQLSPGVNVSEVDLTTVVPSVATTVGGFAGNFNWGPVDEIVTINNELQLVERFGKPDSNTFTSFFTAANFLAYGSDLRLLRSAGADANNATSSGSPVRIDNRTDYEQNHSGGSASITFAAKYPGSLGNGLKVSMCDANTELLTNWLYRTEFNSDPANTAYAESKSVADDEIHIVVVDTRGTISGVANTVIEKFGFTSKAGDAKNSNGTTNYYKDVINSQSKYVWWLGHPTEGINWGQTTSWVFQNEADKSYDRLSSTDYELSGGIDAAPSAGILANTYNAFDNPDSVDVSLIMGGSLTGDTVPDSLISLAEARKDCLIFL